MGSRIKPLLRFLTASPAGPGGNGVPRHHPARWAAPDLERVAPEVSRRTVANLLLAVGGLLIGIAAVAFAAVSWGSIGTGGRAAILLAVSAAALAAPWPLRRRGLGATAESAAAIGLALMVLSASLAYQLLLAGTAVSASAAGASIATAVLAVAWAVYGTFAPVRGPRLAAIGLAQFPLPFAALALAPSLASVTLALVGTAGGDLIVAELAGRRHARPERAGSLVAAIVAGSYGVLPALAAAAAMPDERESLRLSAVLLLAAAVALAGVRPARQARMARRARQPGPLAQPHPPMPLGVSPLLPAPPRTAPRWLSASGALAAVSGALLAAGLALPAAAALPGAGRPAPSPWSLPPWPLLPGGGRGSAMLIRRRGWPRVRPACSRRRGWRCCPRPPRPCSARCTGLPARGQTGRPRPGTPSRLAAPSGTARPRRRSCSRWSAWPAGAFRHLPGPAAARRRLPWPFSPPCQSRSP
jgi:hypothetical protein